MNTARKIDHDQHIHVIICVDCDNEVRGGSNKTLNQSKFRARSRARELDWSMWKETGKEQWLCPVCRVKRVKEPSVDGTVADDAVRKAQHRIEMRADSKAQEAIRRREVESAQLNARAKRKVGNQKAKADSTLTRETEQLIHRNAFQRYTYPYLTARMRAAAYEFERQIEMSEGVSDQDRTPDRVDSSNVRFGPSDGALDAQRWLRLLQKDIGSELYNVIDRAITQDQTPVIIGARFKFARSERDRRELGRTIIKVGLNLAADYMGLRND